MNKNTRKFILGLLMVAVGLMPEVYTHNNWFDEVKNVVLFLGNCYLYIMGGYLIYKTTY